MFKLPVLTALLCSAVSASPSVPPIQRGSGCSQTSGCDNGAGPTTVSTNNLTTPTLTAESISSLDSVKMISELQQTIKLQAQTIQNLVQSKNSTTPANCTTDDEVNSLHVVISELTQTIQRQNITHQQMMSALRSTSTTSTTTTTTTTTTTHSPNDCGHVSGYKYNSETGSCYKYHAEVLVWPRAYDVCVTEGAHLAVINGRRETRILTDMVTEGWKYVVHIGYRRENGEWKAVTGETLEESFIPWERYYPMDKLDLTCVGIWKTGNIGNVRHDLQRPYICEKSSH